MTAQDSGARVDEVVEEVIVAEVPTTWRDRTAGQSRFRLWAWLPHYLRWYLKALAHAWLGTERRYRTAQPLVGTEFAEKEEKRRTAGK